MLWTILPGLYSMHLKFVGINMDATPTFTSIFSVSKLFTFEMLTA